VQSEDEEVIGVVFDDVLETLLEWHIWGRRIYVVWWKSRCPNSWLLVIFGSTCGSFDSTMMNLFGIVTSFVFFNIMFFGPIWSKI
jgi:hypothetical protein